MACAEMSFRLRLSVNPVDMAVALDDEARGLVVLAGDRDFYGQCERVVLAGLGQYDKFRTLVDARHEHSAVITHGADDERRLHVMLAEALLDNRRQELLKAFVHLPSLPVELDDLATGFCALALKGLDQGQEPEASRDGAGMEQSFT
jgi:hypothetical protein